MLKKGLRLRTNEDFTRVFRQGKPLFFGAFSCKVAKNNLGYMRLGFSLSKKHVARAVSRNSLRRIFSEVFFIHLIRGHQSLSKDVVLFTAKKPQPSDFRHFASVAKSIVECISKGI